MDEAKAAARELAEREGWFLFEDGAEPAQFDGYAAIGDELLDQLAEPPGSVVVPVGNGALAIGIFRALAARAPSTERVAVSAAGAPAMFESWRSGSPTDSSSSATFADGLAVRIAIPLAVAELNPLVQRFELVTERELARAVGSYAEVGIRARGRGRGAARGRPAREPAASRRAHRHRPQHRRRAVAAGRRDARLIRVLNRRA